MDTTNIRRWTREFRELDVPHPNRLDIDNTRSSPVRAAKLILAHIEKCREEERPYS